MRSFTFQLSAVLDGVLAFTLLPTEKDYERAVARIKMKQSKVQVLSLKCRIHAALLPAVHPQAWALPTLPALLPRSLHDHGPLGEVRHSLQHPDSLRRPPQGPSNLFIHGPLLGRGGTTAFLPVVYAAVGRRLRYPIKIVAARSTSDQLFARWEGPDGERLNIDVSSTGLCCHPDDFYRTGAFALSPKDERDGGYLKSMTPRQEMAGFLVNRGKQWARYRQHRLAVEALAHATVLVPELPIYLNTLLQAMHAWKDDLDKARPCAGFPQLWLRADQRRYPALPVDVEEGILALEATESLLRTPELETRWWGPMRKGRSVSNAPKVARAEFKPMLGCQISFQF